MQNNKEKQKVTYRGKAAEDKIAEIINDVNTWYPLSFIVRGRIEIYRSFRTKEEAMENIFPIKASENMKIKAFKKGIKPYIEIKYDHKSA